MLKTTQIFLIVLLSLSHCVKSNNFDDEIKKGISYNSRQIGPCGEYFQYQRIDEFVNGILELPNIKIGDTIKMTFSKTDFNDHPRFIGILLPEESSETVLKKIQKEHLISYRVDFPLTSTIPELIKIFVNGYELCATKHNSSDEIFVLRHTMQIINGSLPVFTYNINIPHFVEKTTCGLVDEEIAISGISPLIYGGSKIVRGEFPWLVAIYKKQRTGISFLCGGSILTSRIILTAAHCFQGSVTNADQMVAILGRHNLTNYLEDGYMIHEIETLILHPEYKYGIGFSDADLAILEIKNHVSFTPFIKPICLWFGPPDESLVINKTAVVAGWGSDEDGHIISAVPKKVKLDVVSQNECLRSSKVFNSITSSRTLCAGNRDGSGPCKGDSGGGLMINRYGQWMLRGVVSVGLKDQVRCNLKEYTVYCDVAKHKKWLEKYVGKEKLISGSLVEICGISGTDLRSEHPWLAAVYRKVYTGIIFKYTGEESSPDAYKIYLGRFDLNNIKENNVVTRDIESFIFHPDYKKSASPPNFEENGIALIQMKSPVGFTEYLKPICLWNIPNDGQSLIEGPSVTLSGWDITGVFDESLTVPTSVEVDVNSIQECQSWGYNESMSSRLLCVPRLENKNGAIMMFKHNGRWLIRGINGLRSDYDVYKSKRFFVYLDVVKYLTWIIRNMS